MTTRVLFPELIGLILVLLFVWVEPAQAYIDPGTGSFLFQLLIGTGLAMLATVRVWWGKVVSLVSPRPKSKSEPESKPEPEPEPKSEPDSESEPEPKPKPKSNPEPEPEPTS